MHHNGAIMRKFGIIFAWVVATVVSTVIAANAVGSVRGQVTDVPAIAAGSAANLGAGTVAEAVTSDAVASTPPGGTTFDTSVGPVDASGTASPTSQAPTVSTTSAPASTTTTAASASPSSSTTTTAAAGTAKVFTYQLQGGQVTISAADPEVELVSAVPNAGYSAEVDDKGPAKVEVEFESNDRKSTFRARWVNGALDIDISNESESDD